MKCPKCGCIPVISTAPWDRCPMCGFNALANPDPGDVSEFPKTEDYDKITRPKHYNTHPSGIECIQITEHMNFCLGNALKYLWRSGQKSGESSVDDLKKAIWYIEREIKRLEAHV